MVSPVLSSCPPGQDDLDLKDAKAGQTNLVTLLEMPVASVIRALNAASACFFVGVMAFYATSAAYLFERDRGLVRPWLTT